MKLQEELVSIKNKMGLTESDASDFIEKYEKDLKLAKKLIPQLIKLIKDNFGDDLYKIDYRIRGVAFGSTWIKNEKTGSSQSYSSEKVLFTLEFINKNYAEKREIRHKFFNIIESFTPFNIAAYGSPIDVDFFNYTREEF